MCGWHRKNMVKCWLAAAMCMLFSLLVILQLRNTIISGTFTALPFGRVTLPVTQGWGEALPNFFWGVQFK